MAAWRYDIYLLVLKNISLVREGNAPINSKLQHPPRAYPGHLTVHRARGGGDLNVALEGWGI